MSLSIVTSRPSSTPYGCGLISFGSGGKLVGRALDSRASLLFGIVVVQRDVRIGDRRLLEIFVDAAAAADELRLQLDRHARAVVCIASTTHSMPCFSMYSSPFSPGGISTPSPLPLRISGSFFLVSI